MNKTYMKVTHLKSNKSMMFIVTDCGIVSLKNGETHTWKRIEEAWKDYRASNNGKLDGKWEIMTEDEAFLEMI